MLKFVIYPQKYPSPYLLLIPRPQMKTLYPRGSSHPKANLFFVCSYIYYYWISPIYSH